MNPKLKKIFIKIFGNKSKITADSNMNNVKKWDSLNHIKLMFELEKIKKKKFSSSQIIKLTSVKEIIKILNIKKNKLKNRQ